MSEFPILFNQITVEKLKEFRDSIINQMEMTYSAIFNVKSERTFKNTFVPIIQAQTVIEPYIQTIDYMKNLHPDVIVRNTANDLQTEIEAKFVEYEMRKDIYLLLKSYQSDRYKNEKQDLNEEEIRYFEK